LGRMRMRGWEAVKYSPMCTADGDMARRRYQGMAPEHAKSQHDDSKAMRGMVTLSNAGSYS
jgi:hypothetical protein